jgi:hypothetical protein
VGVEPLAFGLHFEIGNFHQFGRFDEKLLPGPQRRDELDFVLVEMELASVEVPVHVRVGQEYLRRATFNDDVQDLDLRSSASDCIERITSILLFQSQSDSREGIVMTEMQKRKGPR